MLGHCQFILGPEVRALEVELAEFCGARHVVSCASGTDALVLVLMAQGIGPGDAVICPSFTFTATAEVVALVGATPAFADVEEASFNLDPASLELACAAAREAGLRPKAVIPVDLFGQPADYDRIMPVAEAEGHHPDLHLVGYRNVAVELWTHAAGGLTENDFILAAKIDQVPVVAR